MKRPPRIAFAANRNIGVQALRLLLQHQIEPVALLVPKGRIVDESVDELMRELPHTPVLHGKEFRSAKGIAQLYAWDLDYLLSVHFPYMIPTGVLHTSRIGALNLHPAYLPYNRGWHTPSWAILDQTPYGATLHWIDEGMDTGDIALQHRVEVQPSDTADRLYARVLAAEIETLREAIPLLLANALPRIPQRGVGTQHVKADLNAIRRLDLNARMTVGEVLQHIRALTTNRDEEAAWFELDGDRYLVQLTIRQDRSVEKPQLRIVRPAA